MPIRRITEERERERWREKKATCPFGILLGRQLTHKAEGRGYMAQGTNKRAGIGDCDTWRLAQDIFTAV